MGEPETRSGLFRRLWRQGTRVATSPRIRRWARSSIAAGSLSVLVLLIVAWSRSDLISPKATTWVQDRHGELIGELGGSDERGLGYWRLDEVPPRVVAATVAVEDRRFNHHPGVDARAVVRAFWQNMSEGERISGASTLAMQVARLQRPGPRTYPRKVMEALTAIWLTVRHGRREILRQYLTLVPYGNQVHGIGYASRRYFRKPIADLSWAEVAFLVAIPQAPSRMNPYDVKGRSRAVRRGLQILSLLSEDGLLSAREFEIAEKQILALRIPPKPVRSPEMLHALFRIQERIESGLEPGGEPPQRIETYLDADLQSFLAWTAQLRVESWRLRGAGNVSAMVVDLQGADGPEVIAALGSADYFDDQYAGAINFLNIRRSSGSTLKPFLFARALDRGLLSPTRVMDDLQRGASGIGNSDGRFLGPLLPRFALANSRNVPAANLLAELGVDEGWNLFRHLGLHDADRSPERHGLGLVLGSLEVELEDLVQAYTALPDGLLKTLRWSRDEPLVEHERVFSRASARQVTLFLADPLARMPTFPRRGATEPGYGLAVKTGTSSRYRDAWTVAYSSRYLVGVWVGNQDHRPMAKLSGYRSAAQWLREIMDHLHPEHLDGLDEVGFPRPVAHQAVKVCAISGRRSGPACPRVSVEWLTEAGEGAMAQACEAHQFHAVDRRNGSMADAKTPREHVEIRSFVDLPARYAAWQHRSGIPMAPRLGRGGLGGPGSPGGPAALASGGARPGLSPCPRIGDRLAGQRHARLSRSGNAGGPQLHRPCRAGRSSTGSDPVAGRR